METNGLDSSVQRRNYASQKEIVIFLDLLGWSPEQVLNKTNEDAWRKVLYSRPANHELLQWALANCLLA